MCSNKLLGAFCHFMTCACACGEKERFNSVLCCLDCNHMALVWDFKWSHLCVCLHERERVSIPFNFSFLPSIVYHSMRGSHNPLWTDVVTEISAQEKLQS